MGNNIEERQLLKRLTNPNLWAIIALVFSILAILVLSILLSCTKKADTTFIEAIEKLFIPTLTAVAFSVGFILTIQRTNSIRRQTEVAEEEKRQKQQEIKEMQEQKKFIRIRENLRALNEGGVMAIDTIEDLMREVETLEEDNIKEQQRFVSIFCGYLREDSIKGKNNIFELDEKWNGRNICTVSWTAQRIINLLFPLLEGDKVTNKNIFHRNNEQLEKDLSLCNLQGIDFSKRVIQNVNFGGSAMHGVKMHDAEIKNCQFGGAFLQSANFSNTQMVSCTFWDAKLVWANLFNTNIQDCNFYKADMSAVILTEVTVNGSQRFENAILDGSDIYKRKFEMRLLLPQKSINTKGASINFAFIQFPEDGIDNTELGFDWGYDNEEKNRLERYITYLEIMKNQNITTGFVSNLNVQSISSKETLLISLCKKALKYATIDESTRLDVANYEMWTNRMKELMNLKG